MNESFGGLHTLLDEDYVFTFGKYKGETAREVLDSNPGYILWCQENLDHIHFESDVLEEATEGVEERNRNRNRRNIRGWGGWGGDPDDDIPF